MSVIATLLIVFMAGGGAAFAAEDTVPGDFLYPVKIEVNENVRSVLEIGAENDAEWDIRQADRRFKEAVRLAGEDRLSEEARIRLEEKFHAHTESALTLAGKLEEKGRVNTAHEIRTALSVRTEAYNSVLALLEETHSSATALRLAFGDTAVVEADAGAEIALMASADDDRDGEGMEESAELRVESRAEGNMDVDIDTFFERTEKAIKDAEKSVRKAEGRFTARAEAHLEIAHNAFARATASIEAEENVRATYAHLMNAYRAAVTARLVAESSVFIQTSIDEEEGPADNNSEEQNNASSDATENNAETSEDNHAGIKFPLPSIDPIEVELEGEGEVEIYQYESEDGTEVETHIKSTTNTGGNTGSSETTGDAEAKATIETYIGN